MVHHTLGAGAAAEVTSMLQALVVGILLHIGTTVLFEAGGTPSTRPNLPPPAQGWDWGSWHLRET